MPGQEVRVGPLEEQECAATRGQRIRGAPLENPGDEAGSRACLAGAGRGQDARTGRPDEEEPIDTHHETQAARGKGSTGRDSRFGLARPVLLR